MATYVVRMLDAESGNEGRYEFEGDKKLIKKTPMKVVRAFLDHLDKEIFPIHHVECEVNACFKNKKHKVVTAMGSLHLDEDSELPFMMMISPKNKEEAEV